MSQFHQEELEFWCIDELTIEPCCALKYYPEIEQVTILISHFPNLRFASNQPGSERAERGRGEQEIVSSDRSSYSDDALLDIRSSSKVA